MTISSIISISDLCCPTPTASIAAAAAAAAATVYSVTAGSCGRGGRGAGDGGTTYWHMPWVPKYPSTSYLFILREVRYLFYPQAHLLLPLLTHPPATLQPAIQPHPAATVIYRHARCTRPMQTHDSSPNRPPPLHHHLLLLLHPLSATNHPSTPHREPEKSFLSSFRHS